MFYLLQRLKLMLFLFSFSAKVEDPSGIYSASGIQPLICLPYHYFFPEDLYLVLFVFDLSAGIVSSAVYIDEEYRTISWWILPYWSWRKNGRSWLCECNSSPHRPKTQDSHWNRASLTSNWIITCKIKLNFYFASLHFLIVSWLRVSICPPFY